MKPRALARRSGLVGVAGALAVAVGLAGAFASACHKAPAAAETAAAPPIPSGQVWLTETQVKEAKIAVEPIAEQNVDDTILTSGRVTFDDLRVAHVYSPVTGKVVRIDAQLGQRVKKGQALAVIESPEIGTAVSDLHKAEADLIAAEHDFKRQKELAEKHAASQKDLEMSEDNYRKAKAEIERAKQKAYLLRTGGLSTACWLFIAATRGLDKICVSPCVSRKLKTPSKLRVANASPNNPAPRGGKSTASCSASLATSGKVGREPVGLISWLDGEPLNTPPTPRPRRIDQSTPLWKPSRNCTSTIFASSIT